MSPPRARALRQAERADALFRSPRIDAPTLIAGLPPEVPFGFLGRCLLTSSTTEVRIHAVQLPARRSLELLAQSRSAAEAELATGSTGADRSRAELEVQQESDTELSREVAAGEQELWRVGISFSGLGASPAQARRERASLESRLRSLGFLVRVPTYEVLSVVGPADLRGADRRPTGYWHTLPTDAVAAFFPFVDESILEPGGILVGLGLQDASPVVLNRWTEPSHSWGVFGSTAAGKSFAAALWTLRSRWADPDLTLYYLDPLGELGNLADALGGVTIPIGPGSGLRLNPLDGFAGPRADPEAPARFAGYLTSLFPSLGDEGRVVLESALVRLTERSRPSVPTLAGLLGELADSGPASDRMLALLETFRSGSLAYLNGPTNIDLQRRPIAVDLSGVPVERLPFHLAYLLEAVLTDVRGRPGRKLVVVDEAHRLLEVPSGAEFLDRFVRSARHFRAGLLLLSQNPDDFLRDEAGRSTLRNLRATLLLRLNEVSHGAREFFGVTDEEAHWLTRARLPREAGYSEGLLRLGPDHLPLAVVASTPEFEFLSAELERPAGRRPAPAV